MNRSDWNKIAPAYFENIQSPFSKGVKNPMFSMLKKVKNREKKTVLEVGCGIGMLIPFLSTNFKRVYAMDISDKMIDIAKERNKQYKNVTFKAMDAVDIKKIGQKFDVVVCVNSVLMPDIVKVNKVLSNMNAVLKNKGVLIGVFPSFDSIVYWGMISFDKEYEKHKNRKRAMRITNRITSKRSHDYCYGFFGINGKQKHFYGFELDYRLKQAGFQDINLSKVHYPWKLIDDEPKPARFLSNVYEQLWDWLVFARKRRPSDHVPARPRRRQKRKNRTAAKVRRKIRKNRR